MRPFLFRLGFLAAAGLVLAGCQTTSTSAVFEPAPQTAMTQRDKNLMAKIRYDNAPIPQPYRRAIVNYHRKEAPGSILVDSDNHYLYYVLEDGKAIRYGVTVGEEALAFSGVARVGNKREWPDWVPTADIHKRIEGLPARVAGGPDNPLGARALYLYQGNRDTLFRIHGTNQPEYIGASISSGCIRMLNEDVIDLYSRVKPGAVVVVLEPKQGDSPYNPKLALQGTGGGATY
jgi:lipoprotein-anchoring transpeptidase ErfK/SrfK